MSKEQGVMILGEEMPKDMFEDLAKMISPTLKGFKFGCAPQDFQCPVCFQGNNSPVVITECDHIYHLDCIENWLKIRTDCPICRTVLPGCDRKMVEDLLIRLKEQIKLSILRGWCDKLNGLSREEIGIVRQQMQSFVDAEGWNTASFTASFPELRDAE